MAIDLFSVLLEGGLTWGIGRLLDAAVGCRCGRSTRREVTNVDYNRFRCPSCSRSLSQYTNATDHTINRNGSVIAAAVHGIHWPSFRGDWKFYYDLDVINSRNEAVVVEAELSEFRGSCFHSYEAVLKPRYEYSTWEDSWIRISEDNLPDFSCTIALDLNVYNTWGDLLDRKRKLLEYRSG